MDNKSIAKTLHHIIDGYYDAVNAVCSALLVDEDFKIELHGFGFDGIGVPLISRPGVESIEEAEDDIRVLRSYGTQSYHIHRNVIASEATNHEESHKVHVYCRPNEGRPGHVTLSISSNSCNKLEEQKADSFQLKKGVCISEDDGTSPSWRLASDLTQHLLQGHGGHVALMHVSDVCSVRWQHSGTVHAEPGYTGYPGKLMQGTEAIVAFQTDGWPSCASNHLHRTREGKWPSEQLLNRLAQQAVYVVPAAAKSILDQENSTCGKINDIPNSEPCFEWKYSFVHVEKELFETLQEWHIELFHSILVLNNAIAQVCGIQFEKDLAILSKMALFWCLEKGVISSIEAVEDLPEEDYEKYIMSALRNFLRFVYGCVDKRYMDHYFINDCNVLEQFDQEFLVQLGLLLSELLLDKEQLENLVRSRDLRHYLHETCRDLDEAMKERFERQVLQKSHDCIATMFTDMYKLAYMMLYARLHSPSSVDSCVRVHESAQRHLTVNARTHAHPRLVEWCSKLVANSLANLYFAKATAGPISLKPSKHSPRHSPGTERGYYYQKAEELLLMSNNVDLMVGRVRLANFYLVSNRLQEALDLLHDIISATANENEPFGSRSNSNCDNDSCDVGENLRDEKISCSNVRNQLLQVIHDRNCILDLLFSAHEEPVVAPVIREGLSLAKSVLMGMQPTKTFVLDPDIIMRCLKVLTLIQMLESAKDTKGGARILSSSSGFKGKGDRGENRSAFKLGDNAGSLKLQAVEELEKLEQLCNKDQRDMNERRNVAYYNIVAKCYLALGLKEQAISALESSLGIAPNPLRNPAYFLLFSLRNDTRKMMIKGGIGVAIGVGAVAAIVGLAKLRFS